MNFKTTNKLLLCAGLVFSINALVHAAPSTPAVAPVVAKAELATKTEWASGLKEPQGMAHYMGIVQVPAREILIADYGEGKVLRYSHEGKLLGVLAEGLEGPSQIAVYSQPSKLAMFGVISTVFVSERKANRVIIIRNDGKFAQVGEAIEEPLGLVAGNINKRISGYEIDMPRGKGPFLFAVSHTTSKILCFDGKNWKTLFTPTEADRYGYRCLAYDNGTLLLSDEEGGEVLMLSQSGRLASWAKGIADPSGIAIAPDGATYVTDESEGGRLYRVNNLGKKTIVAEGLGRPRGILFLDAKTVLVSDRNGKVWKLVLP